MKRLILILCVFLIGVSVSALSYDKPLRNKVSVNTVEKIRPYVKHVVVKIKHRIQLK